MSANTSTINKILSIFQDMSIRHKMINDFIVGQASDISASRPLLFPYLWVNYGQTTISGPINSAAQVIIYTFEIAVMDKIKKGDSNYQDTVSDTQYVLSTIISEMSQHQFYVDMNIKIEGEIVMEPAQQFSDDNSNGWIAKFKLKVPMRYTYCNSPITPIAGWTSSLSNNITQYRLIGSQGPQGFQGFSAAGTTGSQGPQGFFGNTGLQGPMGFQGDTGEMGNEGPQGPTGIAGGFSITYTLEGGATFIDNNLEMEGLDVPTTTTIRASATDFYGNDMTTQLELWDTEFSDNPTILLKIYDITDNTFYHYFRTRGADLRWQGPDGLQISNVTYLGGCAENLFGLRPVGLSIVVEGALGTQGFQGPMGATGESIIGPQGSQGPQGRQGFQGFQGRQGNQGFQGLIGITGVQGNQGFQGFQGLVPDTFNLFTVQSFTTSSASNMHVPGLTFSTEAGSRYVLKILGYFRSNNASGNPGFGIDGGVGATLSGFARRGTSTAPTMNQGVIFNGVTLQGAATMTANTDFPYVLEGVLVTPNFPGTASLIVTSVNPHILTIQPNSVMTVQKVT